jgi:hypothetical protein
MTNINRVEGGRKGRAEGYNTEDYIKPILIQNKLVCAQLLKIKYNIVVPLSEYNKITINKLDDKRAADLVVKYNDYCVGLDSKKSGGTRATQWMRKRINMFLKSANTQEVTIFGAYFKYKKERDNNGQSVREPIMFNKYKEDIFFNYINKNKKIMIKERWDPNPETWCDYILLYINGLFKIVSIDDLLYLEITKENLRLARTNYCFGKYITFKPYGHSSPDLQFTINKSVFDSNYGYHIDKSGEIIKNKKI